MLLILWLLSFFIACGKHDHPQPRKQELRTTLKSDPSILDPRAKADAVSEAVMRMLFTGLTDFDRDHKVRLALAESYHASGDYKIYTFSLKKSFWSDGTALTAHNFEAACTRALKPNFKEVKAIDAHTLLIELENPDPSFLETLTQTAFYPVHKNLRKSSLDAYVCCGPFKLQDYTVQNQLVIEKNPHYWDAASVKLEKIYFYIVKESFTALMMFDHGELDWIGLPFTEIADDTLSALKKSALLKTSPTPSIQQPYLKDVYPMADFRWAYLDDSTELDQHRRHAKDGISRSFSK